MRMGTPGSWARTWRHTSRPLRPGSIWSRIRQSYCVDLGAAQAQQAIGGQVHGVVLLGQALVQESCHGGLVFN